jgi:ATP-dependent DNA helicase RecG
MFSALLMEGKEPPQIQEIGDSVQVSFPKRELNAAFRLFVTEESKQGRKLGVDDLLILQFLLQHHEIDTNTSAALCQRSEVQMRDKLSAMESAGYIEHGGSGRGTYWCMQPELYNRLADDGRSEARRRIDWDAAKTRVLSILMDRAKRGEEGLRNAEIRKITKYSRNHVITLMKELATENGQVRRTGHGAGSRYYWEADNNK